MLVARTVYAARAVLVAAILLLVVNTSYSAMAQVPPVLPVGVISTELPLKAFADVLVDHARRQIFVTGGRGDSKIVVLDYEGTITQTIEPMPSAAGMALVGDTLYVGREGGAAIDLVDPKALKKQGSRTIKEAGGGDLTYANGRLWMGAGECNGFEDLQYFDLQTQKARVRGGSLSCPTFFSAPMNPHLVLTGQTMVSPASVVAWDTSHPTRSHATEHGDEVGSSDIAPSSDARTFLSAYQGAMEFRVTDMEQTGVTYPLEGGGTAVAQTDAQGGYVAVGSSDDQEENLHLFRRGETTPVNSRLLPGGPVAPRSLRFAPEESKIFAVTFDEHGNEGDPPTFHVVPDGPTAARSRIDVSVDRRAVASGQQVRVRARLHQAPEDATIEIVGITFGRDQRTVASGSADNKGVFETTLRPARNITYVARWDGNAEKLPAVSGYRRVLVRPRLAMRLGGHTGRSGRNHLYGVNKPIRMTARAAPAPHDRKLNFQVNVLFAGRWRDAGILRDRIGRKGMATNVIYATRPASFRIRATVSRGWDRLSSRSKWRYLRAVG